MMGVAIFTGIYYWIMKTDIGYGWTHAIRQPLFASLLIGIIMGNVTEAVTIGAAVQIMYIGLVAAGSNLPADDCLAGLVSIPIALQTGMDVTTAISLIAVPVGIMGVFIDQLRKTVNIVFVHMADKYAADGNYRQVNLCNFLYPLLLSFVMRFPIPFLANMYGADAVTAFMNSIPQWIINGFNVAGGLLPALGFALTMFVIGKKELLPWFFIGYFLIQFSGIPVIGAAVFGVSAILLINGYRSGKIFGKVGQ
ncbi:MAG: PTS sugar transporter subunit IIC [Faecalicoccus sp.]|uniref:PTS mannose/fructose/sorbose/N-acetylgalactosamine transporter subunit IIC n=1 Tax=Faecalicoccus sp. TaxID=1971758 RepID=UPI002A919719|nr:PTS sugar transporter subunit IIC [Faecalicoccus sp.]MDY5232255.1 PTS sugar transporter subunit IIC [Faecalicoccus sp.]